MAYENGDDAIVRDMIRDLRDMRAGLDTSSHICKCCGVEARSNFKDWKRSNAIDASIRSLEKIIEVQDAPKRAQEEDHHAKSRHQSR